MAGMFKSVKRVLVVDDEVKIIEVVKTYLENENYVVYTAESGEEAIRIFDAVRPSLIILDLMMPEMSGEEVCEVIRKKSRVPIIMLTAKTREEDFINGIHMGADDYITKPFSPKQLVAKVLAILRRTDEEPVPLATFFSYGKGDLTVNDSSYEVTKAGEIVNLTPIEYTVLISMIKYPTKVFTREELIFIALGPDYNGYDRAIDTHIKNLRQKIETDIKSPKYITTVHGIGYRFGGI